MVRDAKAFFPNPIPLTTLAGSSPLRVDLGGFEAVAVLHAGQPFVYRDLCPHMGGPLSEYDPRKGTVSCPWHGYRFDAATGKHVFNPNQETFACMAGLYKTHKPETAPALKLQSLAIELDAGQIWVRRP